MKKIYEYLNKSAFLLAIFAMALVQSCTTNDAPTNTVDNDTIAEVWEFNRSFSSTNNFSALIDFPHDIYASDMVLIYRLAGTTTSGADIWKQMPETFYFNDGTLDFQYTFDFTRFDANVYMEGFDLANVSSAYRTNQIIRIVIVPAYFGNKNASTIDYSNYNEVVAKYKISKIQKID